MKFYMSYWSYADTTVNEHASIVKFFKEKSIYFLRKNYKEIHLITDHLGKKKFGDLNWTSVSTELESFPRKYGSVWSAGKIMAINKIAKRGEPFMHIDYDFMLIKPLKEDFLKADVVVEHVYNPYGSSDLIFSPPWDCPGYFLKNCKNLHLDGIAYGNHWNRFRQSQGFEYFLDPSLNKKAFNCGIVGGNDLTFFKRYTAGALEMLFDKNNQHFWSTEWEKHNILFPKFNRFTKALLLEQFYLGLSLSLAGINPKMLLDNKILENFKSKLDPKFLNDFSAKDLSWMFKYKDVFEELGYIHFLGLSPKVFVLKYIYNYPDKNKLINYFNKNFNSAENKIDYRLIDSMSWMKDSIFLKE